ncbi:pyrokinin-1 receptor-like isoform X2 [Anthonomus grandis grandis]|nr:pyrokinin-1 receptor-like isoform X2 [Anthonomus grandis grandis]
MSKLSRAIKFILIIWVVAISLAIPQALPLKVRGVCPLCLPTEPIIQHSFEISTILFFIAPMTVITVLYMLIGSTLNTSNMMKARSNTTRIHSKSSKKVVKMLIAVVVAFFICWAPFHLQRLYTIYTSFPKSDEKMHSLYLRIYALVTYISGIFYYMSATTNPILYSIMSVKFREAFKETLFKCCGIGIQRGKPPKQYSILSKSNLRGVGCPSESTEDSAKDQTFPTNTSLTCKNSNDSFTGNTTRFNFSIRRLANPSQNQRVNSLKSRNIYSNCPSLPVVHDSQNGSKLGKFTQYFICLAKDPNHRLAERPISIEFQRKGSKTGSKCDSCDISNSSLKDIEHGAIEDELTAYISDMKDDQI